MIKSKQMTRSTQPRAHDETLRELQGVDTWFMFAIFGLFLPFNLFSILLLLGSVAESAHDNYLHKALVFFELYNIVITWPVLTFPDATFLRDICKSGVACNFISQAV